MDELRKNASELYQRSAHNDGMDRSDKAEQNVDETRSEGSETAGIEFVHVKHTLAQNTPVNESSTNPKNMDRSNILNNSTAAITSPTNSEDAEKHKEQAINQVVKDALDRMESTKAE